MDQNQYLVKLVKPKKKVGRGIGSGKGKTCGRGTKGQKARKSGRVRPGFEGGQIPIYRRLPKQGFTSYIRTKFTLVNLENLENNKNIINGQVVDYSKEKKPVKILGTGSLSKVLIVQAKAFSESAKKKIEQLGGKIKIIN